MNDEMKLEYMAVGALVCAGARAGTNPMAYDVAGAIVDDLRESCGFRDTTSRQAIMDALVMRELVQAQQNHG